MTSTRTNTIGRRRTDPTYDPLHTSVSEIHISMSMSYGTKAVLFSSLAFAKRFDSYFNGPEWGTFLAHQGFQQMMRECSFLTEAVYHTH